MSNLAKNIATALVVAIASVSVWTATVLVEVIGLATENGYAYSYAQIFGLAFAYGVLFFITGLGLAVAAVYKRFGLI